MSSLSQLEKEFYATITNRGGYVSDLKREAFDYPFVGQGEINFLKQFITDYGGNTANLKYASDLWIAAVAATGQIPTKQINQNKRLFYQSATARLYSAIKNLSGLVAYYPLNEQSGSIAYNRAPATLGTLNGDITGATIGQAGQVGRAYSFDGVNDLITISDNASLRGMANVSWVFMLNLPQETLVFRKVIRSAAFDIGINNNGKIFSELVGVTNGNSGTWDNQPAGGVDDSTWRIFALTYDGTNIRCYINAVEVDTVTNASGSLSNSAQNLVFGNSGSEWYKGLAQHFALFNRALTANEILELARIAGLA